MKRLLLSISFVFGLLMCYGQSNLVKGSQYLGLKYGMSKYSVLTYGQLEYGWCFKEKMVLRPYIGYEHGRVGSTDLNIPSLGVDYMHSIFSLAENRIYANLGAGGFGGHEFIQSNRNDTQKMNKWIVGARAFYEMDFYITDRFSLKGQFSQWYSPLSNLGNWHYDITLGCIYVINK